MVGSFTYPYRLSLKWGWLTQIERLDGHPNTSYDDRSRIVVDYFSSELEAKQKFEEYINGLRASSK